MYYRAKQQLGYEPEEWDALAHWKKHLYLGGLARDGLLTLPEEETQSAEPSLDEMAAGGVQVRRV